MAYEVIVLEYEAHVVVPVGIPVLILIFLRGHVVDHEIS